MKIPLVYPKIPDTTGCQLKKCVVFEKLDGTNIHMTISQGRWKTFGTRRDSFSSEPVIGEPAFVKAHPELKGILSCDVDFLIGLDEFINDSDKYKVADVILFFEYCGPKSFAGSHQQDDYKRLYLIDVQLNGKILPPEEFLEDFGPPRNSEACMPKVIYKGKYFGQLVEDIRNGKYKVNEGAVIKGVVNGQTYMAKVKTNAYMERLKAQFKDNWKDYWE